MDTTCEYCNFEKDEKERERLAQEMDKVRQLPLARLRTHAVAPLLHSAPQLLLPGRAHAPSSVASLARSLPSRSLFSDPSSRSLFSQEYKHRTPSCAHNLLCLNTRQRGAQAKLTKMGARLVTEAFNAALDLGKAWLNDLKLLVGDNVWYNTPEMEQLRLAPLRAELLVAVLLKTMLTSWS